MALINCPDCRREVSNRAPACIFCGCPLSVEDASNDPVGVDQNAIVGPTPRATPPEPATPSTPDLETQAGRDAAKAAHLAQTPDDPAGAAKRAHVERVEYANRLYAEGRCTARERTELQRGSSDELERDLVEATADRARSDTLTLAGIGLVVAGLVIGLVVYFVVPVWGDPWMIDPDSPYTGTSALHVANLASCDSPPHAEISDGPSRLSGHPEAIDACYINASAQRSVAIGIALAGLVAGAIVLAFRHPAPDQPTPRSPSMPLLGAPLRRWDWRRIGSFTGRTRPSEFWAALAIAAGLSFLGGFIDGLMGSDVFLFTIVSIGFWIWLFLGSSVNRLHDLGRSGWGALLYLVPLVNFGLLLVLGFEAGQTGRNEWGPPIA